jgi:hypothetical protein
MGQIMARPTETYQIQVRGCLQLLYVSGFPRVLENLENLENYKFILQSQEMSWKCPEKNIA